MLPLSVQIAFAALAVIGLGLPHGASDLALIPADRRRGFLLAYVGAAAAVVALWLVLPAVALIAFLLVSVAHFATEDDTAPPVLRWATATIIVAGPALLHREQVAALFAALLSDPGIVPGLTGTMTLAATVAVGAIVAAFATSPDKRDWFWSFLALGVASAVALPPLVGFAIGFVLLHAKGQTRKRMAELGCATTADFLRRVAPAMAGALFVIAAVALIFARHTSPAIGTLFAALSALAVPHMAVTPFLRREREPLLVGEPAASA